MPEPYEIKKVLPLVESEIVTIPATSEKRAELKWITAITVVTPSPKEEGRFTIEYRPMTSTGEIIYFDSDGRDTIRTITVNNLYAFKDLVPELNIAFGAVLACVNPIEDAIKA